MNSLVELQTELSNLFKARYSLLYLCTPEEERALECLSKVAQERRASLVVWSRTQGLKKADVAVNVAQATDPNTPLKWVEDSTERVVLVLKDFHPFLKEPSIVRKLRDLAHLLKTSPKNIVLLSPVATVPPELSKEMTLLEMPLPSQAEILELIQKIPGSELFSEDLKKEVAQASSGLTLGEIENVLAKSLVSQGALSRGLVHEEKRQIVKKSGVLEFIVPRPSCRVGGLGELKQWLKIRKTGFSEDARAANLPLPKGLLLVGVPGCGKSLTATTISQEWGMPLLRLDMGRVFSGVVGSSEANLREALRTSEAVAPCVLWMDEIEKGLSGSQSSGRSDGGTSSRVFGAVLTWMQEKTAPVFVVATANDISQLPVELLRKGRFDEIFFVDLPDIEERNEILGAQLAFHGWNLSEEHHLAVSQKMEGFSGAEIEQALVEARFLAFSAREDLGVQHIDAALASTVPLSSTMPDRIHALRSWAENRARFASARNKKQKGAMPRLAQSLEERTASA